MADHTILVMSQDAPGDGKAKKGDPIVVRPAGHVWARKEGLPQFILIDVPDSDKAVLDGMTEPWGLEFVYRVLAETPTGWRLRIEVDPTQISPSGRGRNEITPLMQTWVAQRTLFDSRGPDFLIVTLPKLGDTGQHARQLDEFKLRFGLRFFTEIENHRFRFTDADVDFAIGLGGRVAVTESDVIARIQDKRAV